MAKTVSLLARRQAEAGDGLHIATLSREDVEPELGDDLAPKLLIGDRMNFDEVSNDAALPTHPIDAVAGRGSAGVVPCATRARLEAVDRIPALGENRDAR